jgi:hypothetical protein
VTSAKVFATLLFFISMFLFFFYLLVFRLFLFLCLVLGLAVVLGRVVLFQDTTGDIVGVLQIINKADGPFDENDEEICSILTAQVLQTTNVTE